MEERDEYLAALTPLIDLLDRLGIAWYVGGSVASVSGGAKVDHGSGGTVPLRRSKTLPVCEPFPVTGRVGRFIPWSCIARSVWRAGTG